MGRTLLKTDTPGWYVDPDNPDKKTRAKPDDKVVSRSEWEQAKKNAAKTIDAMVLDTGKVAVGPTTTIKCVDCGKERTVKVQDAFQVKRCVEHQKEHRLAKRRERNARKRKAS
jgi:hypothetical protein